MKEASMNLKGVKSQKACSPTTLGFDWTSAAEGNLQKSQTCGNQNNTPLSNQRVRKRSRGAPESTLRWMKTHTHTHARDIQKPWSAAKGGLQMDSAFSPHPLYFCSFTSRGTRRSNKLCAFYPQIALLFKAVWNCICLIECFSFRMRCKGKFPSSSFKKK